MASDTTRSTEDKMLNFMKWVVGCATFFVVALFSTTGYYNKKDRDDLTTRKDEAEIEHRKFLANLINDTKSTLAETRIYAEKEIDRVKSQTHSIALERAHREIDLLFSGDKMQGYIREGAVKTVKNQVEELAIEAIRPVINESNENIDQIALIFDAAVRTRIGHKEGLDSLISFANFSKTIFAKRKANEYLKIISRNYSVDLNSNPNFRIYDQIMEDTNRFLLNHYSTFDNMKTISKKVLERVNNSVNLYNICEEIQIFNKISGNNISCLRIDSLKILSENH